MANQKGEVEFPQDLHGQNGRVVWLGIRIVRIRSRSGAIHCTIDCQLGSPNTALLSTQGWCGGCRLSIGRNQIMGDVLDEQTFTLQQGK